MADAKKCDRCGNYYERDHTNNRRVIIHRDNNFGAAMKGWDICPSCTESLYLFMNEFKKQEVSK